MCDMRFIQRNHLERHSLTHTGMRSSTVPPHPSTQPPRPHDRTDSGAHKDGLAANSSLDCQDIWWDVKPASEFASVSQRGPMRYILATQKNEEKKKKQ